MGSVLPLHRSTVKASAFIRTIQTPKRIFPLLFIFIFILYSFRSSTHFSTSSIVSTVDEIDYNINPLYWAPALSDKIRKSAYPKSYFTPAALWENELKPISAVLLRVSDDDDSIIYSMKHLLRYHFIKEMYIYNTIKHRPITAKSLKAELKIDNKDDIRIMVIESDEELKSMARFTICATAAHMYCYFQDDTYLNPYMDSLYTNFLRYPTLVHANSKPSHYENEMKWRFYNEDINLHTGYADFRYGAFVPRWKVQTFLTQLGKSGLSKDNLRQAENYFSIWTNQYPWLLSNPPQTAKGTKATDADIAYPEPLDRYTYDAIRHLQRSLEEDRSSSPQDYFERIEESPLIKDRDVRSSCANDKCLFMTNMDPFVPPEEITFDYRHITTIPQLENKYEVVSKIPHGIEWDEYSYQRVVDLDPNTCWNTLKKPKEGDYFGLIFVGSIRVDKLVIHTPQEIKRPDKQVSVTVMESNNIWITCRATDETTSFSGKLTLKLHCPNSQYYRAIKVTFIKSVDEPFELCGLTVNTFSV